MSLVVDHTNVLVHKPWGDEYLVYSNDDIAIWCLRISPGKSTSLHSHLNKKTSLILLDGKVTVKLGFYDTQELESIQKLTIRPGLFHATSCISDSDSFLFEIETPVDKNDLVRFSDQYGRQGLPYEGKNAMSDLLGHHTVISDPTTCHDIYQFASVNVKAARYTDMGKLTSLDSEAIIVFLKGGVVTSDHRYILGPGDAVHPDTILKLTSTFQSTESVSVLIIHNAI